MNTKHLITAALVGALISGIVASAALKVMFEVYDQGFEKGKAEACKDVNDISYFRTATCEVFRDE